MVTKVLMPKPGWITEEGKVVRWLKKEGDRLEKGQPLFEVELRKLRLKLKPQFLPY